jgi:SAM-dependent methyltransferase
MDGALARARGVVHGIGRAAPHDDATGEVADLKRELQRVVAARDAAVEHQMEAGKARDALLQRVFETGDLLREYQAADPDTRPESTPYRAMDMPDVIALHRRANELSDSEWVESLIGALTGDTSGEPGLPDFPTGEHLAWTMYPSPLGPEALRYAAIFISHLKELVAAYGPITSTTRVLDVGCGWGRIYRLMLREVWPPNLYGFDVDPWLVALCKACLPPGQFASIHPHQSLPYDDGSFDLLYANSVLSHLTAEEHIAAVSEWSRVLAPGGVLVATVMPESGLDTVAAAAGRTDIPAWYHGVLENIDEMRTALAEERFAWASSGRRGRYAGYGVAFIGAEWLGANWPEPLEFKGLETFTDYPHRFAVGRKEPRR